MAAQIDIRQRLALIAALGVTSIAGLFAGRFLIDSRAQSAGRGDQALNVTIDRALPAAARLAQRAANPSAPLVPASAAAVARSNDSEEDARLRAEITYLRAAVSETPREAIDVIGAANRAHPGDVFSEERAALLVDALVNAQQIGQAREYAEEFLTQHPRSAFAEHVRNLTGVHPRPLGPHEDR